MSTGNGPTTIVAGHGLQVAVIAASWHTTIMDGLIHGAMTTLEQAGTKAHLLRVPGTFELPVVAGRVAQLKAETRAGGANQGANQGTRFDAIVALGVVIRGGTPHFEYVCQAATHGL